jgi:diguanylate cyclase (GGDEF)-like protein
MLAEGQMLSVTVSVGVATLDDFEREHAIEEVAAALVGRADQALYQAKENGRNQVVSALP